MNDDITTISIYLRVTLWILYLYSLCRKPVVTIVADIISQLGIGHNII